MDNFELIVNELNMDLESSGLSKEEYIEEVELVLNSKKFMDYSIVDMVWNNLEIDDKELVLNIWKDWKVINS